MIVVGGALWQEPRYQFPSRHVQLLIYSAGRAALGFRDVHWTQELLPPEAIFEADLQVDAQVSVTHMYDIPTRPQQQH